MSELISVSADNVALSGALNRDTIKDDVWVSLSEAHRKALTDASQVNVQLDGIEHIDSAGLAWLLNFKKDANRHGVALTFCDIPKSVMQLAALSGIEHLLQTTS